MIAGCDILCFSTSPWEAPYGSRQELMSRLAQTNRVLFVEYQAHWLHAWRYPQLNSPSERTPGRLHRIGQSLWVYTPPLSLPGGLYAAWINRWNQAQLRRSLQPILRHLGFRRPILWIYPPRSALLLGRFNERARVYHCIEAFEEQRSSPSFQVWMRRYGRQLVTQCDVVMACSRQLCEQLAQWRRDVVFLPPGIDTAAFNPHRVEPPPPELQGLSRPLLGYAGSIDQRIDVELLERVARACPEATIVLVGPVYQMALAHALQGLSNVRFVGAQPKARIPAFIQHMDVCLIPYTLTPFTKVIFPLKLFEYLAMGKAVVSTDLPEIHPYASIIRVAKTPEQFIAAVKELLGQSAHQRQDTTVSIPLASWEDRLARIAEALTPHVSQPTLSERTS